MTVSARPRKSSRGEWAAPCRVRDDYGASESRQHLAHPGSSTGYRDRSSPPTSLPCCSPALADVRHAGDSEGPRYCVAQLRHPGPRRALPNPPPASTRAPEGPTPPRPPPAVTRIATPEHLAAVVAREDLLCLEFTAAWCQPCQRFKPRYRELAEHFEGDVAFASLDLSDPELEAQGDAWDIR